MISNTANTLIKKASLDDFKEVPHAAGADITLHESAKKDPFGGQSTKEKFKRAYNKSKQTFSATINKAKGFPKAKAAIGAAALIGATYGAKKLYDKYKSE